MTYPLTIKPRSAALAIIMVLIGMVSLQIGAALAKQLFPIIGASGATALRLAIAALVMCVVARPWRLHPTAGEWRILAVYGLSMGVMNLCFYTSLGRIPLGIAVALEFTGPLAVAMVTSRHTLDFVWIGLAAVGLIALLPLSRHSQALDPSGVGFALLAGVCWALYIVFGQKAGKAHGAQTAALGTLIAAVAVVPVGILHAGTALLAPTVLPVACAVALLSSALPYTLEMFALTRLPTRTFGVLMSVEPALGALSGLMFLGERLTGIQWLAIACVIAASAGSAAMVTPSPSAAG